MAEYYEGSDEEMPPDPDNEGEDAVVNPPFSLPEEEHLDSLPTGGVKRQDTDTYIDTDGEVAVVAGQRPVGDYDDYGYEPPVRTRRRPPSQQEYPQEPPDRDYGCADVITALFLLMTVTICAFTALLIAFPRSPLNPFPPPTFPALMVIASPLPTNTATTTFTPLPATETPLPTATSTPTATFTATWTPTVTFTPVIGGFPNATTEPPTPAVSAVPQFTLSPFPFTVQPIRYQANSGKEGCNWQSIAGSAVDLAGKPIGGLAIHVTGSNGNIDEVDHTGTAPKFGVGGFEVFLGATPHEDQYSIQLLGRTGTPISDAVAVETHTDCKQNVVVVTFVENHPY